MQLYKDYAPTGFDRKGLNLPDNQDWLVAIGQNRDSDALDRSNYECAVKLFEETDPDERDHEQHCFNHWACGWLEIIIVRPDSKAFEVAKDIEAALADYPVLDDDHYSELEWAEHSDWIDQECGRVATSINKTDTGKWQKLNDRYNTSDVADRLEWWSEHDRSPSGDDIREALTELGFLEADI